MALDYILLWCLTFTSLQKPTSSRVSSRVFVRIRSGSVIGRVQEFLATAHYGCKLSTLRGILKKVRGDRGEWGVSGCSPHRRTPLRNRSPPLPPPASPAASSWPPAARSQSSSTDTQTERQWDTQKHLTRAGSWDKFHVLILFRVWVCNLIQFLISIDSFGYIGKRVQYIIFFSQLML